MLALKMGEHDPAAGGPPPDGLRSNKIDMPPSTSPQGVGAEAARQEGTSAGAGAGAADSPTPASSSDVGKADVQPQKPTTPVYCALSPARRRFILAIVTAAGMVGPLSGAIYLPVLPLLEREFNVGSTSINATVSVFMVTFAIAVRASIHQTDCLPTLALAV